MSTTFMTGHVLEMLGRIPDNYIHCGVTSPPYFGLRRYKGFEDLVWGGREDCQHEWGEDKIVKRGTPGNLSTLVGTQTAPLSKEAGNQGAYCQLCGAWRGQLGSEPTIDLYITHLVQIFREVRRVLRPDGQFWLNIGDSAAGSGKGRGSDHGKAVSMDVESGGIVNTAASGLKPLDTCLIPFRIALALQADGWYVHSDNIWSKPNCMPRSYNGWRFEKHKIKVKLSAGAADGSYHDVAYGESPMGACDDRDFANHNSEWQDCPGCSKCLPNDGYILRKGSWSPTESHEYIFQLVKSTPYFGDREAVKEPYSDTPRWGGNIYKGAVREYENNENIGLGRERDLYSGGGRNLRSVWEFPVGNYKGAHFAVFPYRLPEIAIKASTSEYGVCDECGSPWARVVDYKSAGISGGYDTKYTDETIGMTPSAFTRSGTQLAERDASRQKAIELFPNDEVAQHKYIHDVHEHDSTSQVKGVGWRPTCSCHSDVSRPIVLDPFGGSGTTSVVADRLNCDSIYIDTSEEYTILARVRLLEDIAKRKAENNKNVVKVARQARKMPLDNESSSVL